jgi:hypothetical protein
LIIGDPEIGFHRLLLELVDRISNFFQDKTKTKKNPDALPNAGVREAIEPPTMGNGK